MTNLKISLKKIDYLIFLNLVLLIACLYWINYSDIDIKLQNHLFNFESNTWLFDKDEPIKKFIFYQLPKILLGCLIVFCLVASILGFARRSDFFYNNRHRFFLTLLGLILIPTIAGNIKKFTNIYCPNRLEIYGGDYPYVKILEKYDADFAQIKKGKCFPAGHAITGFALLILFFTLQKKSHRFFGMLLGLAMGWILGFYQMAKGVHFFGDTLVAMLVCFLLAAIIAKVYFRIVSASQKSLPPLF